MFRGRFPDTEVLELPGLFKDLRESSLVATRLNQRKAFNDYGDFYVIGMWGTAPYSIHTNFPVSSIADLKGKTIRASRCSVLRLGGTASAGDGTAAAGAVTLASQPPAPPSSSPLRTAGCHRGALDNVQPGARGQRLVARDAVDHGGDFPVSKPVDG